MCLTAEFSLSAVLGLANRSLECFNVAYQALNAQTMHFLTWNDGNNDYEITDAPLAGQTCDVFFYGNEKGRALEISPYDHLFLFASPCTMNYNEFAKEDCFVVYMNPWTQNECQQFDNCIGLRDHDGDSILLEVNQGFCFHQILTLWLNECKMSSSFSPNVEGATFAVHNKHIR